MIYVNGGIPKVRSHHEMTMRERELTVLGIMRWLGGLRLQQRKERALRGLESSRRNTPTNRKRIDKAHTLRNMLICHRAWSRRPSRSTQVQSLTHESSAANAQDSRSCNPCREWRSLQGEVPHAGRLLTAATRYQESSRPPNGVEAVHGPVTGT